MPKGANKIPCKQQLSNLDNCQLHFGCPLCEMGFYPISPMMHLDQGL